MKKNTGAQNTMPAEYACFWISPKEKNGNADKLTSRLLRAEAPAGVCRIPRGLFGAF
jgi:hypothetical protein